jgi:sortase (surface protein transpeptidase)
MTPAFKKISAIALILFAAGIFLSTLSSVGFGMQDELTDSGLVPPGVSLTGEEKELAAPARIRIPSIGVDAFVQDVGIGKSGNMAVPTNYDDVGWYRYGPAPGEKGSAVIDGHVDNGFGLPAVFSRLSELEAGDDIYIDTED